MNLKNDMTQEGMKKSLEKAVRGNALFPHIQTIKLFGSYLHGTETETSDIDLLVEFDLDARVNYISFFSLQEDIRKGLGKKIDLLTPNALSPYLRKGILDEAKKIYEKGQ